MTRECFVCKTDTSDFVMEFRETHIDRWGSYLERVPICANRRTCLHNRERAKASAPVYYSRLCPFCEHVITFTDATEEDQMSGHIAIHPAMVLARAICKGVKLGDKRRV